MARGWESKSVEQQQEEMAQQRKSFREKNGALVLPTPSPKEQQRNRKREGLLLSRGRLTQQLQAANHPRHRQMLEQAIAEVDRQLSSFEQVADTKSRE
jgi:predicted component of type VI protein secretion system